MGVRVVKIMLWGLIIAGAAAIAYMVSPPVNVNDMYWKVQESVTRVHTPDGYGSSFLIRAKSGKQVLITNGHVCDLSTNGQMNITVGEIDGTPVNAHVSIIKVSDKYDLCALSDPGFMRPLELGSMPETFARVFSAGYPLVPLLAVNSGNITGYGPFLIPMPEIEEEDCEGEKYDMQQVDDDGSVEDGDGIEPLVMSKRMCVMFGKAAYTTIVGDLGNSGSPMLDEDGKVVGVIFAVTGGSSVLMAVPFSALEEFLGSL